VDRKDLSINQCGKAGEDQKCYCTSSKCQRGRNSECTHC
jgi:hypothetical protein